MKTLVDDVFVLSFARRTECASRSCRGAGPSIARFTCDAFVIHLGAHVARILAVDKTYVRFCSSLVEDVGPLTFGVWAKRTGSATPYEACTTVETTGGQVSTHITSFFASGGAGGRYLVDLGHDISNSAFAVFAQGAGVSFHSSPFVACLAADALGVDSSADVAAAFARHIADTRSSDTGHVGDVDTFARTARTESAEFCRASPEVTFGTTVALGR